MKAIASVVASNSDLTLRTGRMLHRNDSGLVSVRDSSGLVIEAHVLRSGAKEVQDALTRGEACTVLLCVTGSGSNATAVILGIVDVVSIPSKESFSSGTSVLSKEEPVKSLVVEATERIELKCGESAISLTRDGKVSVRGVDVSTRAKRNNKLKGATVQIN